MSGQKRRIPFGSQRPNYVTGQQPSAADPSAEAPAGTPPAQNADNPLNQRSSFRCPIQVDQQVAVLASKRKRHAVRLLNRSAGGFCVAYTGPAQFKSGQVLRLLSLTGEHRVRVVYALRNQEDLHIGLMDLGLISRQPSRFASSALFVIVAVATAVLVHFF